MENKQPRFSFQDLKSRVGIDDVAYALGYRVDRRAGVGRYFEMVLGDSHSKTDTIIIKNTTNKAAQTYFRRDGSSGDVVSFVRENLTRFNEPGNDEWRSIINILSKFANMPAHDFRHDLETVNAQRGERPFDPSRFEIAEIDFNNIPRLLKYRGFDKETIMKFSPFVKLISDRNNKNFNGFNIGFPYISSCQEGVVGYEIRGYNGFKSKASGTNSSSGAWIADFTNGNNLVATNVFFFESAFDAMAFYQINRTKLHNEDVFASIGGSFSDKQILSVMDRFPNARMVECFDNDLAGRVNAVRLLTVVENIPAKVIGTEDKIEVHTKNKSFTLNQDRQAFAEFEKYYPFKRKCGQWQPPSDFKDWNDCLLGKKMSYSIPNTKNDRDMNLSERRKSSLKA